VEFAVSEVSFIWAARKIIPLIFNLILCLK